MDEQQTPEQLRLLPSPEVPVQFRLDVATRRRGLQHVAEIKQMLAERRAQRTATSPEAKTERAPLRHRAA
jgi:hypothetical protein